MDATPANPGAGSSGLPFDADALGHHRRLVERMTAHDAAAFRQFYETFFDRLYGLAYRILMDHGAASDIVQETFVKAWQRSSQYQSSRGEVITWLSLMCRSAAIDLIRKQKRHGSCKVHFAGLFAPPDAGLPGNRTETHDLVTHHLENLSAAQREALELAYFENLTQNEIAGRMRISAANVKNHLRRGLLKLRQSFNQNG